MLSSAAPPHPRQQVLVAELLCWNLRFVHHELKMHRQTAEHTLGGTSLGSLLKFVNTLLATCRGTPGIRKLCEIVSEGRGASGSMNLARWCLTCSSPNWGWREQMLRVTNFWRVLFCLSTVLLFHGRGTPPAILVRHCSKESPWAASCLLFIVRIDTCAPAYHSL